MLDNGDNTIGPLDDSAFVDWLGALGYNTDRLPDDLDIHEMYQRYNTEQLEREEPLLHWSDDYKFHDWLGEIGCDVDDGRIIVSDERRLYEHFVSKREER